MLDLPPPDAYIEIDTAIWTQADRIRWPSALAKVLVFKGSADSPHKALRAAGQNGAASGLLGDQLILVLGAGAADEAGSEAWNYLATREAFKLAVYYHGMRIPHVYLDAGAALWGHEFRARDFVPLHRAIDSMHRDAQLSADSVTCDALVDAYEQLDVPQQLFFGNLAYWGWPGEFYVYATTFNGSVDAFAQRHRAWFAGVSDSESPPDTGVKVVQLLDTQLQRDEWQARALNGESLLAILSDTFDCDLDLDEGSTTQLDGVLFEVPEEQ